MKNWINYVCRQQAQLLTGRRDIIVVASVVVFMVSEILQNLKMASFAFKKDKSFPGRDFCIHLLIVYITGPNEFKRGTFRVKGDTVDINLPYVDYGYRITFFGDEIEEHRNY